MQCERFLEAKATPVIKWSSEKSKNIFRHHHILWEVFLLSSLDGNFFKLQLNILTLVCFSTHTFTVISSIINALNVLKMTNQYGQTGYVF